MPPSRPSREPRRSRPVRRHAVAQRRSGARRPIDGRGRQRARPLEYWFGATGGGVWKTTDGGSNWAPMTDGKITTSSVGALAVVPVESRRRLHRRRRDAVPRQHHPGRRRLQDRPTPARRGRTSASRDTQVDRAIRVHPDQSATSSTPPRSAILRRAESRARRLQDRPTAARRGTRSLFRDDKTGAVDLSIDPKNPDVIYAALWEVVPHAVVDVERRSRQRPVQVDRRRRHLDRDHARTPACRTALLGQGRRRRSRAPTATASTRIIENEPTAASSCPTTPARRGRR